MDAAEYNARTHGFHKETRSEDRPRPIESYTQEELDSLTWADPTNPEEVEMDLAGYWMDPAGGIHPPFDPDDDYDPASLYE